MISFFCNFIYIPVTHSHIIIQHYFWTRREISTVPIIGRNSKGLQLNFLVIVCSVVCMYILTVHLTQRTTITINENT